MENTIKKITATTIKNAVKKAINDIQDISKHHNRIREEEYYYSIKKSIERANTSETDISDIAGKEIYIYYICDYNQGTSKFPNIIDIISEIRGTITRVTNDYYIIDYRFKLRKSRVIAYRLNRANTRYELTDFNNYLM